MSLHLPDFKTLTLTENTATSCLIGGLRAYTRYEFFLTPYFQSIEGQPSNSKIVLTQEDGK